jgi:hypothetical protein
MVIRCFGFMNCYAHGRRLGRTRGKTRAGKNNDISEDKTTETAPARLEVCVTPE